MSAIEIEFRHRLEMWEKLQQSPNWPDITAQEIKSLRLYSGQAGIYRDVKRTGSIGQDGIAVSIRNVTGHYSDEIDGQDMIYSYPDTNRIGRSDAGDIASIKNAMTLQMPIFVISDAPKGRRHVRLGWVSRCEDSALACLIHLDEMPSIQLAMPSDETEVFVPIVKRNLKPSEVTRIERDPKFKFNALARYKTTCAVSDIKVERMLDAAHVIPVASFGSDDARNSLLINAAAHRAFDANFWAIRPDSLKLATRERGPSLEDMRISRTSLKHLEALPHAEAIEIRWKEFEKASPNWLVAS